MPTDTASINNSISMVAINAASKNLKTKRDIKQIMFDKE
jgi:hypothetical protein